MYARTANHNRISHMFRDVNRSGHDSVNDYEHEQKVSRFNDKERACLESLKLVDVYTILRLY